MSQTVDTQNIHTHTRTHTHTHTPHPRKKGRRRVWAHACSREYKPILPADEYKQTLVCYPAFYITPARLGVFLP